jgi:hypothetical protein
LSPAYPGPRDTAVRRGICVADAHCIVDPDPNPGFADAHCVVDPDPDPHGSPFIWLPWIRIRIGTLSTVYPGPRDPAVRHGICVADSTLCCGSGSGSTWNRIHLAALDPDPYWFQCGSGSRFLSQCGSGYGSGMRIGSRSMAIVQNL